MLELNLPSYPYRLRKRRDALEIWDAARRVWTPLLPEEWVRQHVMHYLLRHCSVPRTAIAVEKQIERRAGMRPGRFDLMVWNLHAQRCWLLVESKAPYHPLKENSIQQIGRYNAQLNAQWLWITNGLEHALGYWAPAAGRYLPSAFLPAYPSDAPPQKISSVDD